MLEPTAVNVNGREYTVQPFNPETAFSFLHLLAETRAMGRGAVAIGKIALNQCLTPELKALDNKANFQAWFAGHPEDMLELETKALDVLVAPWEGTATQDNGEAK